MSDLIQQTAASHKPLRIAGESKQQGALVSGELDSLPVAMGKHASFVDCQISKMETFCVACIRK
ncbi:hypothetical protein [Rhizobium mesosinicum]|uniref:Uncharacterized protein n=1 Tax=Rhizobium mesosinicum TaxID=335017 RepID=A0ABS7GX92_9HYPH|nr:hypothetical protein [Rhizobium mesosinicum]MBW9054554.1 hypothetical protein [Rhizobium mesosinicum]